MAYEESLVSISLDADDTIGIYTGVPGLPGSAQPNTGKQYRFLKASTAAPHSVGLAAAGDVVVGVLQNKPQTPGSAATVAISGVSLVTADAAVGNGEAVGVGADGGAAPAGAGAVIGVALQAATDPGHLIPILLKI